MLSGYDREHRIFGFLFEVSSLRVRPYLLESSFGKLVVGTLTMPIFIECTKVLFQHQWAGFLSALFS